MSTGSPRLRAIVDLLSAHRELSLLEWVECRRTMAMAAACLVGAVAGAGVMWIAINAAVVFLLREVPVEAFAIVIGMNGLMAVACAFQVRRLLRRPLFPLTKQEAARDARTVLAALT